MDRATGTFCAVVSQGQYTVEAGTARTSLTALSAGSYQLDLRQDKAVDFVDFTANSKAVSPEEVLLQLSAEGMGAHTFTARVDNLELLGPSTVQVDLGMHKTREIVRRARVIDPASPWIAVLFPDGQFNQHRELTE